MKQWLCAVGLALSLGCATAVVRPYVGDQQAWPTASGGIVNTTYGLPVFTSLPPSSYDVLGELRISSPFYAQPEEGHMPRIVKKAREIGADAVVFVQGKIFFSTNYGARNGPSQDTPAGLPSHQGATVIDSKLATAPAAETVETAPATPVVSGKKDEPVKVEESNTNAAPLAPTTNFEPGNSHSQ